MIEFFILCAAVVIIAGRFMPKAQKKGRHSA